MLPPSDSRPSASEVSAAFAAQKADGMLRQKAEGYGRPIISTDWQGRRVVAVGKHIHFGNWRFFTDFLIYFAKITLGREWGQSLIDRGSSHPFLNWLRLMAKHQKDSIIPEDNSVFSTNAAFATALFRFAYALYLIAHHDEIPKRLLKRLRDQETFRPAALETLVVATFVLAGFSISMGERRRIAVAEGEFAATTPNGLDVYNVEAKRKTNWNASTDDFADPAFQAELKQWIRQKLYSASRKNLSKPIYWLELSIPNVDTLDRAESLQLLIREALRSVERDLRIGGEIPTPAYVFFTCHGYLASDLGSGEHVAMLEGFHIPMHVNGDRVEIEDAFDERDRDRNLIWILRSLEKVQIIPHQFDGTPDALIGRDKKPISRFQVGKDLTVEHADKTVLSGIVTSVTTDGTIAKVVMLNKFTRNQYIIELPLTEEEKAAAEVLGNLAFGDPNSPEIIPDGDVLALYDFLLKAYADSSREKLLSFLEQHANFDDYRNLPTDDLRKRVCREWAKSMVAHSGLRRRNSAT